MKVFLGIGMAVLVCAGLTGCVGIHYKAQMVIPVVGADGVTRYATNTTEIAADRIIWSTGSYAAVIGTNGTGSLTVSQSKVDSVALSTILNAITSKAP